MRTAIYILLAIAVRTAIYILLAIAVVYFYFVAVDFVFPCILNDPSL